MVKAVCLHTTVLARSAGLDQLAEGLQLFDIIDLILKYSLETKCLFVHNPASGSSTVQEMIALFEIVYSIQGSSKWVKEEATYMHWHDVLHDLANDNEHNLVPVQFNHLFPFLCVIDRVRL